jgi:hypothetical protein
MSDKLQFVECLRKEPSTAADDKLQPKSADKKSVDSGLLNVYRPSNDFCEFWLFTQKVKALSAAFSSAPWAAAPDRLFEKV